MPLEPSEVLIDTEALPWKAMGEGTWGKILRVCGETGAWSVLFKQEAGSYVPPHRHLAAADFFVLRGRLEYRGGVATAGCFGREPLGALHEKTSFPEETLYLFTSYGPLALLGSDGSIAGTIDAEAIQAIAES